MASVKKNKEINHNNLVAIKPITDNQKVVFESFKKGKNQFLFGAAGTGKTFVSSVSCTASSHGFENQIREGGSGSFTHSYTRDWFPAG